MKKILILSFFVSFCSLQAAQESLEEKYNTYVSQHSASDTQMAWCKINKNESTPLATYDQNTIHAIQTIILATYKDGQTEDEERYTKNSYGRNLKQLVDLCSGYKDTRVYYAKEGKEHLERKARQFTIRRDLEDENRKIDIVIEFEFIKQESVFMVTIQEPGIRNLYRDNQNIVALDKASLTLYFDHKKENFREEAILYTNVNSAKKIPLEYKKVSRKKIIQIDEENLELAKKVGIKGLKQKGFTFLTLSTIANLANMYREGLV